jgi:hypothetical protein
MSRHWRIVPKAMQKLAVGLFDVKSVGMFPYETYYVLATDTDLQRLYNGSEHLSGDNALRSDEGHLLEPV